MNQAKQNKTKQSTNLDIFVWLIYVLSHTKRAVLKTVSIQKAASKSKFAKNSRLWKWNHPKNIPICHIESILFPGASVYVYVFWICIYLFYQELTSNFTNSVSHFAAFVAILFVHILRTIATVTRAIFWDITIVSSITAYSTLFTKLQIIFFIKTKQIYLDKYSPSLHLSVYVYILN